MAINERLVHTASAAVAGGGTGNQEEGLILHLDANDVDSYDGDGDVWYDIHDHEYTPSTNVSEHFNTVLYTGDGSTSNSITGTGFEPDFLWISDRTAGNYNAIQDSVRGIDSIVFSALDSGEQTSSWINSYGQVTSFDNDGFTVSDGSGNSNSNFNQNGRNYVAWCFKAGGVPSGSDKVSIDGTSYADEAAAGLTAGNVAVTKLSANTDLGFSIATLDNVATSSNKTFSHGLGVAPEMVIGKIYDGAVDNWYVMLPLLGANNVMFLNTTDGSQAWSGFNNTAPDSNHINLAWTTSTIYKMVFYSFASKRGVSKVGSYAGIDSTDVKVSTGFEPAWLMIKKTNETTGSWAIFDNKRNTDDPRTKWLRADLSSAEYSNAGIYSVDFDRDGFTVAGYIGGNDTINDSGDTYIYYAVAKDTNETSLIPDTDLELHLDAGSFDGSTNTPTTWTDSSGNSNNGTITGATFDSELGNYLNITSDSTYIDVPTANMLDSDFTIEMWYNLSSTSSSYKMLLGGSNYQNQTGLGHYVYGDTIKTWISVSGATINVMTSPSVITANKWQHIVLKREGSTWTQYIDGEQVHTATGSTASLSSPNSRIGRHYNSSNLFTSGKSGQVRVYSSALTQSQIRQNYNFTKPSYPNGNNFVGINMDSSDWNSNGYFSFNGTNEYFDGAGFTPSLTDVQTVSYWVKNPTVSSTELVMTIGQTGNSNVYSWINFAFDNTGKINASYGTTNGDISNKTTVNSASIGNTWYHVCFLVFPENRGTPNQCFKIYIDGSEVAVTNSTTTGTLPTVQGYPIIGRYGAQNQLYLGGDLSKLRIYNKRITEAEITALYNEGE